MRATAESKPLAVRWIVDVSNTVAYANWIGTCVGIQRVEFELLQALCQYPNFIVFSTFEGEYWNLTMLIRSTIDVDALIAASRRRHPLVSQSKHGIHFIPRQLQRWLRRRFRPPVAVSGDRLILAGSWWDMKDSYHRSVKAHKAGAEVLLVLYDLIPVLHKELTGHDYSERFIRQLKIPMHICSISQYTLSELQLAIDRGEAAQPLSVNVLPLAHEFPGAPRNDRSISLPQFISDRLTGRPYVLCVGTVEIRKNHARLLDAWTLLNDRHSSDLPVLVVAGKRGWKADSTIARLMAHSGVVFVEAPKDLELRALYSHCLFTVFPSVFEGWGLPLGESLWFGKACASSGTSTMPEVGGDLCVYFDPHDCVDIADKIEHLLDLTNRMGWEDKIRAAHLRRWSDVGASMSRIVEGLPSTRK